MNPEIHPVVEGIVSVCLVVGALFVFVGSLGLVRLRDFYSRQHGPSKASTLGAGATLLGSIIYFTSRGGALSLHEVLITFFLFITAPVGAHLLAKAALHLKLPNVSGAPERGSEEARG